ncbi:MAG: response regulator transcription factor [Nitrospiria bacterium]
MNKKKVLIVDDEPDIVESIKFSLELEGFETLEAQDGEEGLAKARREKPHLILLDVNMPKMNGYKVCRLLKFDETYKKIPVIMLTARTQDRDAQMGEQTGADEYITKPFDMDALMSLVKQHLK